jgi:hypothetical protein
VQDPLSFGHVELVHVGEYIERQPFLDRLLLGVDLRGREDLPLRKEPLRLGAGLSAVPVIAPVHDRHGDLLLGQIRV